MTLSHPIVIAPNLEPGARIGKGWLTLKYADRPGDEGRVRYVFTIFDDSMEYIDDTLQSGRFGEKTLYDGFQALLSFFLAEADAYRYFMRNPEGEEDPEYWIMSREIGEWCYQNEEDLETLDLDLAEHPGCIKE